MKETRKWTAVLLAGAAAVSAAAAGLGNLPAKRRLGEWRPSPRREPKPKKQRRPAMMNEVKRPKKPLIFYYVIVMVVLLLINLLTVPWLAQRRV